MLEDIQESREYGSSEPPPARHLGRNVHDGTPSRYDRCQLTKSV
jgi:hypothetical protein